MSPSDQKRCQVTFEQATTQEESTAGEHSGRKKLRKIMFTAQATLHELKGKPKALAAMMNRRQVSGRQRSPRLISRRNPFHDQQTNTKPIKKPRGKPPGHHWRPHTVAKTRSRRSSLDSCPGKARAASGLKQHGCSKPQKPCGHSISSTCPAQLRPGHQSICRHKVVNTYKPDGPR